MRTFVFSLPFLSPRLFLFNPFFFLPHSSSLDSRTTGRSQKKENPFQGTFWVCVARHSLCSCSLNSKNHPPALSPILLHSSHSTLSLARHNKGIPSGLAIFVLLFPFPPNDYFSFFIVTNSPWHHLDSSSLLCLCHLAFATSSTR